MSPLDAQDWRSVQIHRRYLESLLDGDPETGRDVLVEALREGLPRRLYLDLMAPALAQLGIEWQSGRINVAEFNHASQLILDHLGLLRRVATRKPPLGAKVVVTTLAGDRHTAGARIVADFLHLEGFQVDFLGADTPPSALVDFAHEQRPNLVALSVTVRESLSSLGKTVDGLRRLSPQPRILAGGRAVVRSKRARAGIDGVGADAAEAVVEARRLLGLADTVPSLDEFLRELGKRIQAVRHSRGWSQTRLAELAGVDRSYVSSVENGKHNLTVSVALRLAEALQIPLELLLGNPSNSPVRAANPGALQKSSSRTPDRRARHTLGVSR